MNYISDRIMQMSASETLAMTQLARELKAQGRDVLSLSIGEPDFNTPEVIKEAGIENPSKKDILKVMLAEECGY